MATVAIARNVPLVIVNSMNGRADAGKGKRNSLAAIVSCSAGHRYSAYCAKPIHPEAIDNGALKVNWKTKRNASQPPTRGPYIARR